MFLGEFEHTIDDKGRVMLPAQFREAAAAGLILTRGFERCLQIFSRPAWQALVQRVNTLPLGDPEVRNLRRLVFASAVELEVDRQGRIFIPAPLRRYAGLNSSVAIAGLDSYFELWAREQWQGVLQHIDDDREEIGRQLAIRTSA